MSYSSASSATDLVFLAPELPVAEVAMFLAAVFDFGRFAMFFAFLLTGPEPGFVAATL